MPGLFDLEDPMVALSLGLIGGTSPNFGQNILSAAQFASMQRDNAEKRKRDQMQQEMMALQLKQTQQQMTDAEKRRQLAQQFMHPGIAPLTPNDDQGNPMPSVPPSMDWQGYAGGLAGLDPMQALTLQSQLAQMGDKGFEKLGPGDSLYNKRTGKIEVSTPDKPPPGFKRDAAGNLIPDPEWLKAQKEIRAAGKTSVTVENKQESAFAQNIGKQWAENYGDLMKADATASGKINKLARLDSLLTQSGNTGKLTPATMELQAAAASLGLKVDPKLPFQQAAQALSNEIALEMRNPSGGAGMPGALSDRDREFLQNMVPNLSKTPQGNKILIESAKKLAQRDKEVAALAREYKKQTGKFDEGFYQVLSQYSSQHPLFDMAAPPQQGGRVIDFNSLPPRKP